MVSWGCRGTCLSRLVALEVVAESQQLVEVVLKSSTSTSRLFDGGLTLSPLDDAVTLLERGRGD